MSMCSRRPFPHRPVRQTPRQPPQATPDCGRLGEPSLPSSSVSWSFHCSFQVVSFRLRLGGTPRPTMRPRNDRPTTRSRGTRDPTVSASLHDLPTAATPWLLRQASVPFRRKSPRLCCASTARFTSFCRILYQNLRRISEAYLLELAPIFAAANEMRTLTAGKMCKANARQPRRCGFLL